MFSRGNLGGGPLSRGGECARLSNLSRGGEAYLSRLANGGERCRRSSIGEGSRPRFAIKGDRGLAPFIGDPENLRVLGGDLAGGASLLGEYPRGGDLGRPLRLPPLSTLYPPPL